MFLPDELQGAFLRRVKAIPFLSPEEEVSLHDRYRNGDAEARRTILESHLPHVVSQAWKYRLHGSVLEMVQVGFLGLISAFDHPAYDPRKGRLITWSWHPVHNAIQEYLLSRKSLLSGLPKKKGYHAKTRDAQQQAARRCVPLIDDFDELFPGPDIDPAQAAQHSELRDAILSEINSLSVIEREILARYYFRGQTMKEITAALEVCDSKYTSLLHCQALKKLAQSKRLQSHVANL